ncbi:MAG: ATP-binding cassette domain-containing protein [Proteobacteria bacterium]|nr:ATP-binding cassette domain-containing protein [Pseudomonadota bacterium]
MKRQSILPLTIEKLCFDIDGRRLLHDLNFSLKAGARSVILGPNGAGKSLTLRLCHGLAAPTSGEIRWNGHSAAQARARQAMVFQRPVMLRRSVSANIDYVLACQGVKRRERGARIADALDRTGLTAHAAVPARVLSVGEQQRLALARVWVLRPEVLFLDEPTASLDPAATRAVEDIISSIHAAGTKVVLTTQNLGQARRLADDVLFMFNGRLLEQAPADIFFKAPRTSEARAFIEGEF